MKETIFFAVIDSNKNRSCALEYFPDEKTLKEFYDWLAEKLKANKGGIIDYCKVIKTGY